MYAADMNTQSCTTPAVLTTAITNMGTAYTDASSGAYEGTPIVNQGSGDISGMTLQPGYYTESTGLLINTGGAGDANGVTLHCSDASDVFVFFVSGGLTVGSGAQVTLTGSCQASNIYWAVAGTVSLGTTSSFQGTILSGPAASSAGILMNTGASLTGRALSQVAVTLLADTVTVPTAAPSTPVVIPSGGGGPRSTTLTVADNLNNHVILGNSTTPVLTTNVKDAATGGIVTKKLFFQTQLPATLTLQQNQIANISFACSFSDNGIQYTFANNIWGVGVGAKCNKNYTTYGGSFAGIYTTALANASKVVTTPILPVVVVLPTNTVVLPTPTAPVVVVPANALVKTLPFPWLGSGYYEIPLNGTNMRAIGMVPGIAYWVTNRAFIEGVNYWLGR